MGVATRDVLIASGLPPGASSRICSIIAGWSVPRTLEICANTFTSIQICREFSSYAVNIFPEVPEESSVSYRYVIIDPMDAIYEIGRQTERVAIHSIMLRQSFG
jgi:hypothetical protein